MSLGRLTLTTIIIFFVTGFFQLNLTPESISNAGESLLEWSLIGAGWLLVMAFYYRLIKNICLFFHNLVREASK